MRLFTMTLAAALALAGAAQAADPAAGEADFKKCKACHSIVAADGTEVVKGGKTGPNLYGVIGRTIGTAEGFKYGNDLVAAGADGSVWDEASLAAYITDPKGWLKEKTGNPKAKTTMSYKHKKGAEDMAAWLATLTD
ncbi:c-type cytochrome [Donghicola mangrovi]|uniref:Cytochrome C n=1 Tax=Donghicola mangrovi TaxID=2729614 RepID=A0A850QAM7_9RHOB|nr:cytochrome C [Donghicola mangrovi]NVO25372.1 cytochrome C [Donghicola mangrovi]